MGPAIFFDTETTSRNDDREIIEAAWIRSPAVEDLAGVSDVIPERFAPYGVEAFEKRYKPSVPIEFGAMAVHHILPHELVNCEPSETFTLPDGVTYLVGHSIDFDWEAIGGPPNTLRICTRAMAEHVWPDADSYSQSALLYMILGPTPDTRLQLKGAHSALTDVTNNTILLEAILEQRPTIKTWSELWQFSEQCRLPLRMPITKARGELITDIDDGLLLWLIRQDWLPTEHPYLHKAIVQEYERRESEPYQT